MCDLHMFKRNIPTLECCSMTKGGEGLRERGVEPIVDILIYNSLFLKWPLKDE